MNKYFIEDFIKEMIMKAFEDYMILQENKHFALSRGYSDPILTLCGDEEFHQFCLTQCRYMDLNTGEYATYCINGVLSTLNGGRIIITSYDYDK